MAAGTSARRSLELRPATGWGARGGRQRKECGPQEAKVTGNGVLSGSLFFQKASMLMGSPTSHAHFSVNYFT